MFNSSKQQSLLNFFRPKLPSSNSTVPCELSSMPGVSVFVNSDAGIQRFFPESENTILPKEKDKNDSKNCETQKTRKFQEKWITEFPWIVYVDGLAKCEFCCSTDVEINTSNKFSQGFNGPFKHETFKFHDKSVQHRKNVENASQPLANTPLAKCIKKMDIKMFKQLKVLFNLSYYIAKHNKPFSDIESLAILSRKLEVDVQNQYANRNACCEFISCISDVIMESVLKELKQSQYISIILDASTDKGTIEELIMYARYLKNGKIEECFLGLLELENNTSESYFSAIEKQFVSLGLDFMKKSWIVGLATDGAANMVGEKSGLCTKFKECLPHILSVHCVAHRLQLSVLYALKNILYLVTFDSVLILIYKFYGHSSKNIKQLQKIANLLAKKILKVQKLHQVRWVASKVGVLRAIFNNYQPILLHLENESNEKQGNENAKGIVKKIKDFRFVATLSFLLDFLQIFKDLSLIFQKQHLLLCQINNEVLKAKKKLENLQKGRGKYEEDFFSSFNGETYKDVTLTNVTNGKKFFKSDRNNMIHSAKTYLMQRFCDINSPVITSTYVFDTFTWPAGKKIE